VKRIDEGKDEDFFEACLAEAVAQAQKQERATIATKSRHVTPVAADGARRTAVSVTPKGRALVGEGKACLQALCLQLRRRQRPRREPITWAVPSIFLIINFFSILINTPNAVLVYSDKRFQYF
jgi:hypothetical protein